MKKGIIKIASSIVLSLALVVTALFAIPASAQNSTTTAPMPMVIEADGSGNILLRGTVQSRGDNSIRVQSWGDSTWTVNTTSSSTVTPLGPNGPGDLSGVNNGDFVGVQGTINQNQDMTIDATIVRNWTAAPATTGNSTENTPAETPSPTATQSTLYIGTVSSSGGAPLEITDSNGTMYAVDASNAVLWNTARSTISFADIQPGDTLRIEGVLVGNILTASIVRDISR